MARPKRRTHASVSQRNKPQRDWFPLSAFAGTFGGFLLAYIAAEGVYYLRPHPFHWGVAAIGGILGYVLGMGWDFMQKHRQTS